MENLKEFINIQENNETLITIYFYNIKKEEGILLVSKELNKVSVIQNLSKKKKLNDRFYNLKLKLEKIPDNSVINSLYLINNDINEYKFTQDNIKTIIEYNLRDFYVKKDIFFDIDYILDLFYNFDFNDCCYINKNNIKFKKINQNKNKIILNDKFTNEKNLLDIVNNYLLDKKINEILLYGLSPYLKQLKNEKNNKIIINDKDLDNNSINDFFYNRKYEKNNSLLENKLNELNNTNTNLDLFVFGKLKKEILQSIECYQLKELYIEERKLNKLKEFIDDSYFNFKIIPIKTLKDGDIASKFINDYNGLMGIKYY
tara:strand:- start:2475 stop:3419 length:945 start_codon:yes stop_codon:yes gene_type:complete